MLGGGFFLYVPLPIVFFLLSGFTLHFLLTQTQFGRDVYAIGNNSDLAVLCGIAVPSRIQTVYVLSSALAAFSGMILASRLDPRISSRRTRRSVAIGGRGSSRRYTLKRRRGRDPKHRAWLLVVGVSENGLNLWNIAPAVRWGITGTLLIVFALLDGSRSRSRFVQDSL